MHSIAYILLFLMGNDHNRQAQGLWRIFQNKVQQLHVSTLQKYESKTSRKF